MTEAKPTKSLQEMAKTQEFYIGLGLAISSSIFIASSFILKKIGLIKLSRIGLRAGSGGFGYLKQPIWWAGLISMGVGEAFNFAAYAFAPASLVTPLGALSVILAAIMSSKFLNERLNLLGKLGCFLCIIGSTIIVIHSPKEVEVDDLNILIEKMKESSFITYVSIILIVSLIIAFYIAPRIGNKNVIVYVTLCSAIGSLTVMSCKALGLALRDAFSGQNDFDMWLPYLLMLTSVVFIAIQMNYLNKALDTFNTSIVTPIYYVIFTTLVIAASAILFREWVHMKAEDIIGDLCGFLVVIVAVILLNAFRDIDVSMDDVRGIMKPKRRNGSIRNSNTNLHFEESLITRQDSKEFKNNYGTSSSSDERTV